MSISKSEKKRLEIQKKGKEMENFEIYFEDLKESTQKELLEYVGVDSPEQLNWDTMPLIVLTRPEDVGDVYPA